MASQSNAADLLPKKLRKSCEETFGGEIEAVIKGWYITSRPAFLDDPSSSLTTNEVMAREALLSSRSEYDPMKALIVVSERSISIVSRRNEHVLYQLPSYMLEEYWIDTSTSPATLVFTFFSQKLSIDYVNIFQIKPKYQPHIEPIFEALKHQEKKHRASQIDLSSLRIQLNVLGTRAAFLLGSVSVSKKTGSDTCIAAAEKLKHRNKRSKDRLLPISVVVTRESIRYAEVLVDEPLADVLIKEVSFLTVVTHSGSDELFIFIEVDERLDNVLCHVILCEYGAGHSLGELVNTALNSQPSQREALPGDPFQCIVETPDTDLGSMKELVVPRGRLTPIKVIGSGQFGTVWLANLVSREDVSSDDDDIACAVKMLRTESSDADVKEFFEECELLSTLDHPNIIKLVGVSFHARPWLAVMEIMNYGDLQKVLRTCKQKQHFLSSVEQYTLMEQAAAGMTYLASQGIVHMDIAARNMLLHANNIVKIADFGKAHRVDPMSGKFHLRGIMQLCVRWMAPETLEGRPIYFSESTDVYSFGVFMWEIYTYGTLPFRHLKSRAAKDEIVAGLILSRPESCPEETYEYMLQTWDKNPESRPRFKELHTFVRKMRLEHEQSEEPRDVGASLNTLLSQNYRRLAKRASIVHRQARKNSGGPRLRRQSVSTSLATMTEESEGKLQFMRLISELMSHTSTSLVLFHAEGTSEKHHKPSFTEDENWTGTMKRKKSQRQRSSLSSRSSQQENSASTITKVDGDSHELVRRDSVEMDLNLFDNGSNFTEFGDTNKV
eukprot:gene3501-6127_t